MSLVSLFGSHRTGKSTLAKAYADKHGIEFVETSVSAIFRDLGLDPAGSFDFARRLMVQREILTRLDALYERYAGRQAIFDRCPLDFMGYTLGDAVGDSVPPECVPALNAYIDDCYDVLNKRFSAVILVQPGIPLVAAAGKAVANPAYIEHLNSLMLGLAADPRCKLVPRYIARHVTDLQERISTLETIIGAAEMYHQQTGQLYIANGHMLH